MTGRVHPNVSPFPTEEWTLCLFATQLSASLQPPTIKVYLSAVRSLRIERGYADPLKGCLRLQHVVKGIKRCKGSSLDRRLPITPHILRNLFSVLNLSNFDDLMFWGACCLAFFGFLRSAEFTLQLGTVFSSSHHLSVADVTVDRRNNPSSIQVCIKASKTDPFRNGCLITLGRGLPPVCPVEALGNLSNDVFCDGDGYRMSLLLPDDVLGFRCPPSYFGANAKTEVLPLCQKRE